MKHRVFLVIAAAISMLCANVQAEYMSSSRFDADGNGDGIIKVDTAFVDIDGVEVKINVSYHYIISNYRDEELNKFQFLAEKSDPIKKSWERLFISKDSDDIDGGRVMIKFREEKESGRELTSSIKRKLAAKFIYDIERLVDCCIKEITVDVGDIVIDPDEEEWSNQNGISYKAYGSIVINIKQKREY